LEPDAAGAWIGALRGRRNCERRVLRAVIGIIEISILQKLRQSF